MFNLRRGIAVFAVAAAVLTTMVTPTSAAPDKATAAPVAAQDGPGKAHILTAEQAKIAPMACWTTIRQPAGPGTTVYVDYNNCSSATVLITPFATKINNTGTYTYIYRCSLFPPNSSGTWTVLPWDFPPENTHNWGVTNCTLT
jgi:hypothetical protein